jgi:F0F1-type ATP synthase assembly protein I
VCNQPADQGESQGGESGSPKASPRLVDVFWIGTAIAISVVAAMGIGYWIDSAAGTAPWFTLGGLAFGVFCAVTIAVRQLRRYI